MRRRNMSGALKSSLPRVRHGRDHAAIRQGKAGRLALPSAIHGRGRRWAGASGLVLQMASHEPNVEWRSVIAAMPLSPTTLSTTVSPASPAPGSRQASTSPSNSPQTAPLNVIATTVIAPPSEAMTELPQEPVAASKKSQKAVRSPNQRNQGWYGASAWGRYAHERPSSSW
jgi:hypothetical protein